MNSHYLGIDFGSSYTKITLINQGNQICASEIIKTLNRDKNILDGILKILYNTFSITEVCATGYGKDYFKQAGVYKTEIQAAAAGLLLSHPGPKTIIDIGGEDIKIIRTGSAGEVDEFYMNSKCAAGTGTFITEIAERAQLNLETMSELASKSVFDRELNSFCTVFAKTEIMKWIFEDVPVGDLARGIYVSIVNRVAKLRIDKSLPLFLIGGVVRYHPFLRALMEDKFQKPVTVPEHPQLVNSLGAAVLAKKHYENKTTKSYERNL